MKIIAIIALCFLFFTMAAPANADLLPLVQCGRTQSDTKPIPVEQTAPCQPCDLFALFKRIIDYVAFTLVPILAGLLILIAGFYIILGGASPEMVTTGRKMLTNTLIALFIIYGSWLFTNFILKSLAGENPFTSNWFVIECVNPVINVSGTIPPVPSGGGVNPLCNDSAALAAKYHEPAVPTVDPNFQHDIVDCIKAKMGSANLGEISTFDKHVRLCNLTRGNPVCSATCSHAVNSCHYGGASGSTGAMAVDYGNELIGDAIIRAANQCGATGGRARCEDASGHAVACTNTSATHVHISSPSCDAN